MVETTYTVTGMHCERCSAKITAKLAEVPGVTAVDIDVPTGRMAVRGEAFDDAAVSAAVAEAGFEATRAVEGATA
ncbi:heavy-metal-associated domain-containing protein [Streptomyces sp. NPDC088387]|uniref:heavy-metal-associated domain-containing protein n=1 Tax=Streptomyces sp. NPDC088387 TaxID=3365859 RepID=UPI00380C9301